MPMQIHNLSVGIAPNCNFNVKKMLSFHSNKSAIPNCCQNIDFCRSRWAKQAEADVKLTRVGSDPQIWRCKSTVEINIIAARAILSYFALLNRNCIFRQILDSFCPLCCSKLCTRKLLVQLLCQIMM